MKKLIPTILFSFFIAVYLLADTLVLKNGVKLEGKYKGGAETAIKFESGGIVQEIAINEITSITFSPKAEAQAAGAAAEGGAGQASALQGTADQSQGNGTTFVPGGAAMQTSGAGAAAPLPASGPITVPAGTVMMIKIDKAISTAEHKKGSVITGALDTDLIVNEKLVAPKGTKLYGTVVESIGGKRLGNQTIAFQFNSIVINGEKLPISTAALGAQGGRGGALKTVAGAALIGGAIDGNEGAKTGALIGAGAAVLAGGKHIQVPAGTIAEVPLQAPLELR